jgi:uncharacterized FAD-dependent dehydrogenase
MIKIAGLAVPLSFDMQMLEDLAAAKLCIDRNDIVGIRIIRQAVHHSDKKNVHFDITIGLEIKGEEHPAVWQCHDRNITIAEDALNDDMMESTLPKPLQEINLSPQATCSGMNSPKDRPVVIGFGPAGLFAALILAESGANPVVLERGPDVDRRKDSIDTFFHTGILDTGSNVQFGEGGAGTFSDGKLKIGKPDLRKMKILREFIRAGAPEEIAYLAKPHIGTDRLSDIVKTIRKKIIALGGEVHFNAMVTEILHQNGMLTGIRYVDNEIGVSQEPVFIPASHAVLAIGHSARDTYRNLLECNVAIKQKSIAIGVRIEHPQHWIDTIQYGGFAGHEKLGAADYRMVVHLPNGSGVYTFCMCPGGSVIAATSDTNCVVTNGMSKYARSGRNANSALLVTVDKSMFGSDHPLAGCEFQRAIEEKAFQAGGGGYKAPVQRLEDFMNKTETKNFGEVMPTYRPGTTFSLTDSYLPPAIVESLRAVIAEMEAWMPGFAFPDALLTGAETRSSSAVYIQREEDLQASGIQGLYPCGEGAGYSGGIISAAVDGIRCAERVLVDF